MSAETGKTDLPFAVAWVGLMQRWAWLVVAIGVALAAGSIFLAVRTLGVQTDTGEMISPDVEFRRVYRDFERSFPQFKDLIVVVVEGPGVDSVEDTAEALVEHLATEPRLFDSIYRPSGDPFFVKNGLLYLSPDKLQTVVDRLAEAQPLLIKLDADPSLRGFFDVLGEASRALIKGEAALEIALVFAGVSAVAEALVQGKHARMPWRTLMSPDVSGPEPMRRLIVIQPRLAFDQFFPAKETIATVRAAAAAVAPELREGVTIRLTGGPVLAHEEFTTVSRGWEISMVISIVLVAVLLVIGLRSIALVLATLATLVIGLCCALGFTALAIGHLNLLSVTFAVLFIGLGIDFGIHYVLRYREELAAGTQLASAAGAAGGGVGGYLLLAAIAEAIGFYAFWPTDYVGLSELGIISGTSMFIAFAANFTVLPALLRFVRLPTTSFGEAGSLYAVGGAIIRTHATAVFGLALALGAVASAIAPMIKFDFNPLRLKDPASESVATFLDLARDRTTTPYGISVLQPSLEAARELAARLKASPAVERAITLADFVPSNQDEKLAVIDALSVVLTPLIAKRQSVMSPPTAADRIEATASLRRELSLLAAARTDDEIGRGARRLESALASVGAGEQRLVGLESRLIGSLPARLAELKLALTSERITIADLPTRLRDRMVGRDGKYRVEVSPVEDVSDNEAMRRFVEAVRAIAPSATQTPVLIVEASKVILGAFERAAWIALIGIGLLLLVVLRNVRDAALAFAPLVLAAVLTVAISVLIGQAFNFANLIVLPLLLGLGVAGGIQLVLRRRQAGDAAALMASSTPRAVLFSSLTTIASFGSLAISDHRGTASMGILLTIALIVTLICNLVVLPAILEWLGPVARRRDE